LAPLAPTVKLPANLVYIAPTVAKLAAYIEKQRQSETHGDSTSDADTHSAAMRDAIDRLTRSFSPTRAAAITDASKASRTFLITGTTGALGSQLLAILLLSPDVRHVFALNRAGKGSSLGERQLDAFRSREIDTEILSSDKLTLLEGSLASSGLGLEGEVLQQVCSTGFKQLSHPHVRADLERGRCHHPLRLACQCVPASPYVAPADSVQTSSSR
jgi:hypothetical protein